jgi:hypothetical protein
LIVERARDLAVMHCVSRHSVRNITDILTPHLRLLACASALMP